MPISTPRLASKLGVTTSVVFARAKSRHIEPVSRGKQGGHHVPTMWPDSAIESLKSTRQKRTKAVATTCSLVTVADMAAEFHASNADTQAAIERAGVTPIRVREINGVKVELYLDDDIAKVKAALPHPKPAQPPKSTPIGDLAEAVLMLTEEIGKQTAVLTEIKSQQADIKRLMEKIVFKSHL